jgi:protein-disulfide isomerase
MRTADEKNRTRSWSYAAGAAVLLAIVAALLATGAVTDEAGTGTRAAAAGADAGPVAAPLTGPTLGHGDAPVTLEYYSDFQCPFCRRVAEEVLPTIVAEYVDTGQAQLRWRDFPALGAESVQAALAARAAHEQGRFWEYHDLLFAIQGQRGSGTYTAERLVALAQQLELDAEMFREDLESRRGAGDVEADFVEGQRLGVTGTPTMIINGQAIVGAQPASVYRSVIDAALVVDR